MDMVHSINLNEWSSDKQPLQKQKQNVHPPTPDKERNARALPTTHVTCVARALTLS